MKFTFDWLKKHLETGLDVEAIGAKLTALGLEVEGIEDRAKELASFTVAHVTEAKPHPNADKLRVCMVDTGSGIVQVVCGAPNARTGMKGVFAPAGSHIPGTGLDLKKGVIRGVESNGMLCSAREMGLGDDHDGIIDLPADAPVGAPFAKIMGLDDPVIDIAVTPDRADCLGVAGVACDLAASGAGKLVPFDRSPVAGSFESPVAWRIDLPTDPAACPFVAGRYFRGLKNGPSPAWLQERLRAIGLRPISALVDITNFVTFDLGRPLHVFDATKIVGDLTMRFAKPGEKIHALDGREYALDPTMTVIADANKVHGIGGIMGGEESGCTDATTEMFLEVALFDTGRTARSGRALGIESDARYRFERGLDPQSALWGPEVAARLVLELCGGEASEVVTAGRLPDWQRRLSFRPARVAALGGVAVAEDEMLAILRALGFIVTPSREARGERFDVDVPSWRPDVEGEADIVEEIVRVAGYDRIPAVSLPRLTALPEPAVTPAQKRAGLAKRLLAARGMMEAVTWSFMPADAARLFGGGDLMLANPISADLDAMRPSILPNLLMAAGRNAARGFGDVALFEVGPQYADATQEGQALVAAGLRVGEREQRHWTNAASNYLDIVRFNITVATLVATYSGKHSDAPEAQRAIEEFSDELNEKITQELRLQSRKISDRMTVNVFDAKADAMALLAALGAPVENLQVTADAPGWYHPGQSGVLRLGPTVIARFGTLHPRVLKALDVKGPAVAFELFLDRVPAPRAKGTARPVLKASPYQAVERDFAFIVDRDVAADRLLRAAKGADKVLIRQVSIFDLFEGVAVGAGKKSVAIAVTLQADDRTLTDEEIEAVAAKIVAAVTKATGAALRG